VSRWLAAGYVVAATDYDGLTTPSRIRTSTEGGRRRLVSRSLRQGIPHFLPVFQLVLAEHDVMKPPITDRKSLLILLRRYGSGFYATRAVQSGRECPG